MIIEIDRLNPASKETSFGTLTIAPKPKYPASLIPKPPIAIGSVVNIATAGVIIAIWWHSRYQRPRMQQVLESIKILFEKLMTIKKSSIKAFYLNRNLRVGIYEKPSLVKEVILQRKNRGLVTM